MFILKKGHQPGVYVPLRALFLVYITIKCPINFANIDWFVDFLFCHKIKYVNLGLLIWLVYFDIVDTLLQFIERNSDSVSRSMLLII